VAVDAPKVKVVSVNKVKGEVPLTEAEIVVSGGRGLKGPENWKIVEDLAHALHAATACSRPVADSGWRPHHEHCLLYTSDAADERSSVDLGGRRIIQKKK